MKNGSRFLSDAIHTFEDNKSIYAVVWAITDEHKRHEENKPESILPKFQLEYFMVDSAQLGELKGQVSALIINKAHDGTLLEEERVPDLLYDWKTWASQEDFYQCIGLLTSEKHLIDFLASFNVLPDEVRGIKETYRLNLLKEMLDISKIMPRIRSIYESSLFEEYEEDKKAGIKAIIDDYASG